MNGRPLPSTGRDGRAVEPPTRLTHWGRPEEALLLDFRVPATASTLTLDVVEHLLRPEELLGENPWRRPPDMAPNIVRQSDRVMIRTPLNVALTPGAVAAPVEAPVEAEADTGPVPDSLPGEAAPAGGLPADSAPPPDTTGGGAGVRGSGPGAL